MSAKLAQPPCQRPHRAGVEEVELRMGKLFHLRARPPGRQPDANQRIDEDPEEALHGGSGNTRVPRYARDVHDLCIHEAGDLEEAAERVEVLDEPFLADLLGEVVLGIGFEKIDSRGVARRIGPDRRQTAEAQHSFEIEFSAEFYTSSPSPRYRAMCPT